MYFSHVFLPPYSPELRPRERVWQDLKDKLAGITVQTLDALSEAISALISYPLFTPKGPPSQKRCQSDLLLGTLDNTTGAITFTTATLLSLIPDLTGSSALASLTFDALAAETGRNARHSAAEKIVA